jgi:hypothetical protein
MARFLDKLLASPLPDGLQWAIENPDGFRYLSDVPGVGLITVPEGFVTDYASIPKELQNILPAWGLYGAAACLHDLEYWTQRLTREQADAVLREASMALGVDEGLVDVIYHAVRTFGESAWQRNAAIKASGYRRMVTGPDIPPYSGVVS